MLQRYQDHVLGSPDLMAALDELKGKRKGCWCCNKKEQPLTTQDPLKCHGQVLDKLMEGDRTPIIQPQFIEGVRDTGYSIELTPEAVMSVAEVEPDDPIVRSWRKSGDRWHYSGTMGFRSTINLRPEETAFPADIDPNDLPLEEPAETNKLIYPPVGTPIKVVTLWQPWATLCALGIKGWETRPETISWKTYRGTVYLHAAKREICKVGVELIEELRRFEVIDLEVKDFPLQAIVGRFEMNNVRTITREFIKQQTLLERRVGDWQEGRIAIQVDQPQLIDPALPISGYQGMWGATWIWDDTGDPVAIEQSESNTLQLSLF